LFLTTPERLHTGTLYKRAGDECFNDLHMLWHTMDWNAIKIYVRVCERVHIYAYIVKR